MDLKFIFFFFRVLMQAYQKLMPGATQQNLSDALDYAAQNAPISKGMIRGYRTSDLPDAMVKELRDNIASQLYHGVDWDTASKSGGAMMSANWTRDPNVVG